ASTAGLTSAVHLSEQRACRAARFGSAVPALPSWRRSHHRCWSAQRYQSAQRQRPTLLVLVGPSSAHLLAAGLLAHPASAQQQASLPTASRPEHTLYRP